MSKALLVVWVNANIQKHASSTKSRGAFREDFFHWKCSPPGLTGFPDRYEAEITTVLFNAESEANDDPQTTDPAELRSLAGRADLIASSVGRLSDLSVHHGPNAYHLAERLRSHSSRLEEWAIENEPREPDGYDGYDHHEGGSVVFDIDMLFSEL